MTVYLLRWGNDVLGVFSSKEKAEEAETAFSEMVWFEDHSGVDLEIEEYELNTYAEKKEQYEVIEEPPQSFSDKVKILLGSALVIGFILLLLLVFLLGIDSCFKGIFHFFK